MDSAGVDVVDKCSADQECAKCSEACGCVGDCSVFTCVFDCNQCLKTGYYEGNGHQPAQGRCARECGWMRAGGTVDDAHVPWAYATRTGDCDLDTWFACPVMVRHGAAAMMAVDKDSPIRTTINSGPSTQYITTQVGEWLPVDRLAEKSNKITKQDADACEDDVSDCRRFWEIVLNVVVEFEEGYITRRRKPSVYLGCDDEDDDEGTRL